MLSSLARSRHCGYWSASLPSQRATDRTCPAFQKPRTGPRFVSKGSLGQVLSSGARPDLTQGRTAVRGKRLFWISVIIVELVMVYVVWKPVRTRWRRPSHQVAMKVPVARQPEVKSPSIITESRKPIAGHLHRPVRGHAPIVNASLKAREPIAATPVPPPKTPLSPAESFWCHISMMDSNCDCKRSEEAGAIW